jgi:hypothetical protein
MAGGVTVPGNMTVKGGSIATGDTPGQQPGTIVSNMGDSWGMLWGSHCALIGQKGKPMRFGFADAYNAAGWDEKVNIQPDGTLNAKGNISVGADLTFPNQTTIKGAGRLHMTGEELLYILNKKGVMIGKEWGGTGDLQVQGNLLVQGRNILAELNECIRYNQQFKMSISDNRGGASGGAAANMIGACNPECGGGARIVSTSEPGRQLGLQINRW